MDPLQYTPAAEYEAGAPAAFGLPEEPVLYYSGLPALPVLVASNGVHTPSGTTSLESAYIADGVLHLSESSISLFDEEAAVRHALKRCQQLFGTSGPDSLEIAVPVECETGTADDLGTAQLAMNDGSGHLSASGPVAARKRARSF